MSVCATFENSNGSFDAVLEGQFSELDVSVGDDTRIRLFVNRARTDESGVHLHIDLAPTTQPKRSSRKKKSPPNTEQQIQEAMAAFLDKSTDVYVRARFLLPVDQLSASGYLAKQIGQSSSFNEGNAVIMGQMLAIENAEIQWLQWSIEEGGVLLAIGIKRHMCVTHAYLKEALGVAREWLRTVIVGDANDEQ